MTAEDTSAPCNACARRRIATDGANPADLPYVVEGLIELGTGTSEGREQARYLCPTCGTLWTVVSFTDATEPGSFIVRGWEW
jgi:hypothetical protein